MESVLRVRRETEMALGQAQHSPHCRAVLHPAGRVDPADLRAGMARVFDHCLPAVCGRVRLLEQTVLAGAGTRVHAVKKRNKKEARLMRELQAVEKPCFSTGQPHFACATA